ncbi:MAG: ABC-F family ATP-binding cassette domain-containing protein, partial [Chloroflexi bacterium]|nr:ABC-F family ATP-binding cassette domain-containing protein [Chloroflexota bacterium]
MIVLTLDRVTVRYLATPIFENLSWEIHDGKIIGLIGPNGSGKSTLLRLIQGQLQSETGYIVRQKTLTIGYLPQEPQLDLGNTVWDEVINASTKLANIEAELTLVEQRLANPQVYGNEKKLTQALDYQATLLEKYTQLGGPGHEGHVRSIMHALGFRDKDFSLSIEALSGGQKKLVGLAKLLIVQPNLLLLDEPDNHLDLEGKTYLEKYIRNYPGSVVIVSHDRYLLDLVVDEIVELEDGNLTRYHGNYSEYAFEKETKLLRQQQLFQVQQKEISRLEQAAKRLLTWGHVHDNEKFIKRGKNIIKRLERIDKLDRPILERKRMGFALSGWRGSNKVLDITNLRKAFSASDHTGENIVLD